MDVSSCIMNIEINISTLTLKYTIKGMYECMNIESPDKNITGNRLFACAFFLEGVKEMYSTFWGPVRYLKLNKFRPFTFLSPMYIG